MQQSLKYSTVNIAPLTVGTKYNTDFQAALTSHMTSPFFLLSLPSANHISPSTKRIPSLGSCRSNPKVHTVHPLLTRQLLPGAEGPCLPVCLARLGNRQQGSHTNSHTYLSPLISTKTAVGTEGKMARHPEGGGGQYVLPHSLLWKRRSPRGTPICDLTPLQAQTEHRSARSNSALSHDPLLINIRVEF